MKRRVRFDSELVIRQMRRLQGYSIGNIGQRLRHRLPRQAKHQVQIKIVQPGGVRGLSGGERRAPVVNPPQPLQLRVVETLHADRQPVNTRRPEFSEFAPLDRTGIGLQGDFRIGTQRQAGAQTGQQPIQRLGGKQTGRAAANEHAFDPPPPDTRQILFQIRQQRIHISRFRDGAARFVRVEVAIRAFTHTPGKVNVQRQGNGAEQRQTTPQIG